MKERSINDQNSINHTNIKINALNKNPDIWLSPPHMSGEEFKYIQEAFDTNWIAPLGKNVDEFEKTLARFCNVKHAAALNSGTAAIHLSLIVLGIDRGDEVLVSSFTFSATVNPIVYQGAVPILIDSESETWNMDPEILESAIKDRISKGKKPKAIIVVHLYGMPAKMNELKEISNQYEIPIIIDAAEALGSRFDGKPVCAYGKMSILSFNGNKIITTSGGGALLSNNKDFIRMARFRSTQARDAAPHYQHSKIGYNYRMSNILAGIGRGQMEVIDERVRQRRYNYSFYKSIIGKYKGIRFQEEPDEKYFSNRWLTTILVDPGITGISRQEIQNELTAKSIESRPLWKPMHLQPVFSSYPAYLSGVSEDLFQAGLCLPSGSGMSDDDRQKVADVLIKCLEK